MTVTNQAGGSATSQMDVEVVPNPSTPFVTQPSPVTNSLTPMFQWDSVVGTSSSELVLDDLTTGQTGVLDVPGLTATSYVAPAALPDGQYQVEVRAVVGGTPTAFSPAYDFELIGTGPPVADIGSPTQVEQANDEGTAGEYGIALAADSQGNYLLAFIAESGSNFNLYGRLYYANGSRAASSFSSPAAWTKGPRSTLP